MKNILILISVLMCLSGCLPKEHKEVSIIKRIKADHDSRAAENGIHLQFSAYGLSANGAEELTVQYYRAPHIKFDSVEKARLFFCHFHTEFTEQFNRRKEIRPFLYDFPLEPKHAILFINFGSDKTENRLLPPYLSSVCDNFNGEIVYTVYDPEKKEATIIHSEPFETAYEIYRQHLKHASEESTTPSN
jgi:hypothetical protein